MPKVSRGRTIAVVVVASMAVACVGVYRVATTPKNGIWISDLIADAERDLKKGTSLFSVQAWLGKRGIPGATSYPIDPDLDGRATSVRNDTWVEDAFITLDFQFDTNGQLVTWRITRHTVWPEPFRLHQWLMYLRNRFR